MSNSVTSNIPRPVIIAEVAQAHDGSIALAHSYIDAVSEVGADAIKFQIHIADEESTEDDLFRKGVKMLDKTRLEYWRRMEFTFPQWVELVDHAREKGLVVFASCFSEAALNIMTRLNMEWLKIASGEVTNYELLGYVRHLPQRVFLSTGMSSWSEIDKAIKILLDGSVDLTVMQCTSKYPTRFEDVGLNVINELKDRYHLKVGLSDHTGTIYPSLQAVSQGVDAIEVHVIFDRRILGPDTTSSVTFDELKVLVEFRNALVTLRNNPVEKDGISKELEASKLLFGRSVSLRRGLKKGTKLSREDLCLKKPGTGIKAESIFEVEGATLIRDVGANVLLRWEDVSG